MKVTIKHAGNYRKNIFVDGQQIGQITGWRGPGFTITFDNGLVLTGYCYYDDAAGMARHLAGDPAEMARVIKYRRSREVAE